MFLVVISSVQYTRKIHLRGNNIFKFEKEEFTNKTFRMTNKLVEQLQLVVQK